MGKQRWGKRTCEYVTLQVFFVCVCQKEKESRLRDGSVEKGKEDGVLCVWGFFERLWVGVEGGEKKNRWERCVIARPGPLSIPL